VGFDGQGLRRIDGALGGTTLSSSGTLSPFRVGNTATFSTGAAAILVGFSLDKKSPKDKMKAESQRVVFMA
jgi:hypothetical protein